MRILVITNLLPPHHLGGYELNCALVSKALAARGHEVRILTSDHGLNGNPPPSGEPHVERSLRIHRRTADGNLAVIAPEKSDVIQPDDVLHVEESFF